MKASFDQKLDYNRVVLENKVPIEQVLQTSKSREQVHEGAGRLNEIMALSGALAVGAKIREDLEKQNAS